MSGHPNVQATCSLAVQNRQVTLVNWQNRSSTSTTASVGRGRHGRGVLIDRAALPKKLDAVNLSSHLNHASLEEVAGTSEQRMAVCTTLVDARGPCVRSCGPSKLTCWRARRYA